MKVKTVIISGESNVDYGLDRVLTYFDKSGIPYYHRVTKSNIPDGLKEFTKFLSDEKDTFFIFLFNFSATYKYDQEIKHLSHNNYVTFKAHFKNNKEMDFNLSTVDLSSSKINFSVLPASSNTVELPLVNYLSGIKYLIEKSEYSREGLIYGNEVVVEKESNLQVVNNIGKVEQQFNTSRFEGNLNVNDLFKKFNIK